MKRVNVVKDASAASLVGEGLERAESTDGVDDSNHRRYVPEVVDVFESIRSGCNLHRSAAVIGMC